MTPAFLSQAARYFGLDAESRARAAGIPMPAHLEDCFLVPPGSPPFRPMEAVEGAAHDFEPEERARRPFGVTVLATLAVVAGYAALADSQERRADGTNPRARAVDACQAGLAEASCIPVRGADGALSLRRVAADGMIADLGTPSLGGSRIPVVTASGLRWSPAEAGLPEGGLVPLMRPDGGTGLALAAGAGVDLSQVWTVPRSRPAIDAEQIVADALSVMPAPRR